MREKDPYLNTEVYKQIAWYDRRSVQMKRAYMICQYSAAILGIALVAFIEVEAVPRLALTLLAMATAMAIVVEQVGQFGRLWRVYRMYAELFRREEQLFLNRVHPYSEDDEDSKRLLVDRVERLRMLEAKEWWELTGEAMESSARRRVLERT